MLIEQELADEDMEGQSDDSDYLEDVASDDADADAPDFSDPSPSLESDPIESEPLEIEKEEERGIERYWKLKEIHVSSAEQHE